MIEPQPYDLSQQSEVDRLMFELTGYMQISRNHGSDIDGREYAYQALKEIQDLGYRVCFDAEPFEPPTVNNEVI